MDFLLFVIGWFGWFLALVYATLYYRTKRWLIAKQTIWGKVQNELDKRR